MSPYSNLLKNDSGFKISLCVGGSLLIKILTPLLNPVVSKNVFTKREEYL